MTSAASKMNDLSSLGSKLKYVRGPKSQRSFADELGVAVGTYQNYERDDRLPDSALLARLISMGWNANWLLSGSGPQRLADITGAPNALPYAPTIHRKGPGVADSHEEPPSQPAATGSSFESQVLRSPDLILAIQLAEEALEGNRLDPPDYGQLVELIYGALINGLPGAQVVAFAKPAARGLRRSGNG